VTTSCVSFTPAKTASGFAGQIFSAPSTSPTLQPVVGSLLARTRNRLKPRPLVLSMVHVQRRPNGRPADPGSSPILGVAQKSPGGAGGGLLRVRSRVLAFNLSWRWPVCAVPTEGRPSGLPGARSRTVFFTRVAGHCPWSHPAGRKGIAASAIGELALHETTAVSKPDAPCLWWCHGRDRWHDDGILCGRAAWQGRVT
jgi:hypothetical protein